jgi:glucose-1-phosphate thymidylyltransferase
MEDIQAVILAAGEGSRLRPLTKNRPKVMLPVANKPILGYVLDAVIKSGIFDITVDAGYRKEQITSFLSSYPADIRVVEQKTQAGTAHALSAAAEFIHTKTLVLSGDDYIDPVSIRRLTEKENAVLVAPHAAPANFGVVTLENGLLTGIIEKPSHVDPGALVSCGAYVFRSSVIRSIQVNKIPDLLQQLIRDGTGVYAVPAADWQGVVFPRDLLPVNTYLLSKMSPVLAGTADKSVAVSGTVSIGENTRIGPGTVIEGPAVIGKGCQIGANVCIGPGTSLGDGAVVEPFSYIAGSIVMRNCVIGSHSRVVDTIAGEGCVFSDHLSSCGVFGDFAVTGPFTIVRSACVGNNVQISGGRTIDRDIPDDALVI